MNLRVFQSGVTARRSALGTLMAVIGSAVGVTLWSMRSSPPPLPIIGGQPESCLACHADMKGFAPAHNPAAIGCSACHLGNRRARTAVAAHEGMTRTPGNLSLVSQTCATAACHEAIGSRVRGSLMNTMSGVVAVDKFVFGENPDLDRPHDIARVGHSPADTHLRTLCASCHLGNDKAAPAALSDSSRGGGCSACHLDYDPRAAEELARRGRPGLAPLSPQAHPMVSLRIPDAACLGCHSRSGRIAMNYEGWHELPAPPGDANPVAPAQDTRRQLSDGRIFEKLAADVHAEKGMACVDCHVAAEVMGDGTAHVHEERAIKIACLDCHPDATPVARPLAGYDRETQMIVTLRGYVGDDRRPLGTRDSAIAHTNAFVDATGVTRVIRQRDGAILNPKPVAAGCGRANSGHAALECRTCHSAWASQCISCHTEPAPRTPGWDHLAQRETADSWTEHANRFLADPPTLGIESDETGRRRVGTFAPGMILTLQRGGSEPAAATSFHRLFAPVAPHTTTRQSRDCRSCHANPVALGYGRGSLRYKVRGNRGVWHFVPEQPLRPEDGLPADAWIGFLREPTSNAATRTTVRPFSLGEQRTILRVGACLECHAPDSSILHKTPAEFAAQLSRCSPRCAPPEWPE